MEGMLFSAPPKLGGVGGVLSVPSVRSCFFICNINDAARDTLRRTLAPGPTSGDTSAASADTSAFMVSLKVSRDKSLISFGVEGGCGHFGHLGRL